MVRLDLTVLISLLTHFGGLVLSPGVVRSDVLATLSMCDSFTSVGSLTLADSLFSHVTVGSHGSFEVHGALDNYDSFTRMVLS